MSELTFPGGEIVARFDARMPSDKPSDDVAEEYCIVHYPEAKCALVVYERGRNGGWEANPWNTRAVIRYLLQKCGMWKEPEAKP